jgi:predicted lipoprotein with Yx(FWY)xxD motif
VSGIGIGDRVAIALAGLSIAVAAGPPPATAANQRPSVRLEWTAAGRILTNGSGFTLYLFSRDRRNHDSCRAIPGCARVWPALTTTRRPVGGAGVRSALLGTIPLHGRVRQITYAGHPVYTYSRDFGPRATLYVGAFQFGGTWDALTAAGRPTG